MSPANPRLPLRPKDESRQRGQALTSIQFASTGSWPGKCMEVKA
jgi:hypothetical protein